MPDATADASILSHGERKVATLLEDGHSVEEIATEREESVESTEKAIDRIRQKTDRALATLIASPFTDRAAADLDPATRDRLRSELDASQ